MRQSACWRWWPCCAWSAGLAALLRPTTAATGGRRRSATSASAATRTSPPARQRRGAVIARRPAPRRPCAARARPARVVRAIRRAARRECHPCPSFRHRLTPRAAARVRSQQRGRRRSGARIAAPGARRPPARVGARARGDRPRVAARRAGDLRRALRRAAACAPLRVEVKDVASLRPARRAARPLPVGRPRAGDQRLDADRQARPGGRLPDLPAHAAARDVAPPRLRAAAAARLVPHRRLLQARVEPRPTSCSPPRRDAARRAAREDRGRARPTPSDAADGRAAAACGSPARRARLRSRFPPQIV